MVSHLSPDSQISVQSSLGCVIKNSKVSSYGLEDDIDINSGPQDEMTFDKSLLYNVKDL